MKAHHILTALLVAACVWFLTSCNATEGYTTFADLISSAVAIAVTWLCVSIGLDAIVTFLLGAGSWLLTKFFQTRKPFEVHGTTEKIAGAPGNPPTHGLELLGYDIPWTWVVFWAALGVFLFYNWHRIWDFLFRSDKRTALAKIAGFHRTRAPKKVRA